MVGYELLAEAQRDLTPEKAAARLRAAAPLYRGPMTAALAARARRPLRTPSAEAPRAVSSRRAGSI